MTKSQIRRLPNVISWLDLPVDSPLFGLDAIDAKSGHRIPGGEMIVTINRRRGYYDRIAKDEAGQPALNVTRDAFATERIYRRLRLSCGASWRQRQAALASGGFP